MDGHFGDNKNFNNISEAYLLNGSIFPVRECWNEINGLFLQDSERNSNDKVWRWSCITIGAFDFCYLPASFGLDDLMIEQYFDVDVISEVLRHSLITAQNKYLFAIDIFESLNKIGIYYVYGSSLDEFSSACIEHIFRICNHLGIR